MRRLVSFPFCSMLTVVFLQTCQTPSANGVVAINVASSSIVDSDEESADNGNPKPLPSIAEFTKLKTRREGFIPFYWDETTGKIHLEVSGPDQEFLYVHSLATGLGSNPVGLDRGQLGDQKVVRFTRIGPKVLLIQRNLRFRANTDNALERRAVEQSFAQSTIWGGTVVAETGDAFVIDVTDLLLSDVHDVIGTLSSSDQGDYSLDKTRSAVFLPRCKAFPNNTELESTLTFSGRKPGKYVRQTTPTPKAITLRQHHSFIELPDDNYRPRKYDVRCPSLFITFADYASPLDEPLEHRWILRHRLQKQSPGRAPSEPIKPITYYVDAGAPKLIQEALVDGASWWNSAFEAAGFTNAFQVKLLPPDADPLDVRYNVIQWVHRSTRGWSYGGSVIDPRTGEIIKGHVTLGSLRVRQDQLLINSLATNEQHHARCACCGIGGMVEESTLAELGQPGTSLPVALARIRQLSAHEVGHTIGFVHNFAASTYGDRASVMDYPAPRVKISDAGKLDFSDAYGVGIGSWDKVSVQYAYSEFTEENETEKLAAILEKAQTEEMIFISDADARPAGAAHPLANLWDNGTDPLTEFKHVMKVRQIAIDNFDPTSLPPETTTADVAQYFTPLYLHHRYQLQAVGKLIGGQYYSYGYANEQKQAKVVPAPIQMEALTALADALSPDVLLINAELLKKISPRPYQTIRDEEILPTWSGRIFEPSAAAKVAIELTLAELLQPNRLNRLVHQFQQDGDFFSPAELISGLVEIQWKPRNLNDAQMTIANITKEAITLRLLKLADNQNTSFAVRDAAYQGLKSIMKQESVGPSSSATQSTLYRRIWLFLERPAPTMPNAVSPDVPPGSPIGSR